MTMHASLLRRFPLALLCLVCTSAARADVKLPAVFGDHMVLQRDMPIRVWGWADQGEAVTVTLGDDSANAMPDQSGRWQVELKPREASAEPAVLSVKGDNTLEVKDVLVGEVWLCSGQSNMEWSVNRSTNAEEEMAAADYPQIRHIKVDRTPFPVPQQDVKGSWQVTTPETVGSFTAAGFFMARHLHKELGVPIGLVNSSWGGTRVEPWTPPVGFQRVEALQDIYQSIIGRTPGTEPYEQRLSKYIADSEAWLAKAKESLSSDTLLDPSPAYPAELKPFTSHQEPTMLYNGMIHGLVGFPIRGAIWYQGESNHAEGMLYTEKKRALIGGWRELWGQGDFPFYYVQIGPYQYGSEAPNILAEFWEAQAAVEEIPNTGMVVINDIATIGDIHPPNKQDVGKRLALLALKHDYGRDDVVAHSPQLESVEVQKGQLKVTFTNTGGGLKTRDGKAPTHFEVIGPGSKGYVAATAKIEGDSVILTSEKVASPTAFRFAWDKIAEPNLMGGTGLPVGAVRGGKEPDLLSLLNIDDDYTLVYDLDLGKLGRQISYDIDNSDSVTGFERIAYLVELSSSELGDQKVFVSMDAFTDDVGKIGIPTLSSGASFQQEVTGVDIYAAAADIVVGNDINAGNIEFWPNNYGPGNGARIPGASSQLFDFGDDPGPPAEGYGSMQVHNHAVRQTVFAINHWSTGANADLGIGNSPGETRDWTFTGNAKNYTKKRLRVYVQ